MREIPKEWIRGIGLLTVREASVLPRQLLRTGNWWFLEDGTEGPVNVAAVCHDGSVSVPGVPPDVNYGRVRPVLRCAFGEEIVVGGGGCVPGYTKAIAKEMDIPEERVALRGEEVMKNITFLNND
ncbi:MAG: hypothetical protein II797_04995, partial [Clostridia bacterium]|nr:hypothetical protein [Clostridia bacterium]